MPSFIYLIEAQNGLVKIGVTVNPKTRAAAYQTHSPVPLRLIAWWPGSQADEAELHRRFNPFVSHCEWFRIEGELAEFLAGVRGVGVGRVREWDEIVCAPGETPMMKRTAAVTIANRARFSDPEFNREFSIGQRTNFKWRKLVNECQRLGLPFPSFGEKERLRFEAVAELDAKLSKKAGAA
jgi:hypothetical protein